MKTATEDPPVSPTVIPRSDVSGADGLRILDYGSIYGARLVATRLFRRGDLILPLLGRLTPEATFRSIQVDVGLHLEGFPFKFMNHSCRPTAVVETRQLAVCAWSEIKAGQEVTFFYPSTEWHMVRPFECFCGAPDCIRYVAGAGCLSLDLLGRYFINPHVRKLAAAALARVADGEYTAKDPRGRLNKYAGPAWNLSKRARHILKEKHQ